MLGSGELRELRERVDTAVYTTGQPRGLAARRRIPGSGRGWSMLSSTRARQHEQNSCCWRFFHETPRSCSSLALARRRSLAAACGGGGDRQSVPADAVAVVGDQQITKAEFDALLAQAKRSYEAQKQHVPEGRHAPSTRRSEAERDRSSSSSAAQFEQEADELGVTVTDKEVDDAARSRSRSSTSAATEKQVPRQS